MTLRLSGAMGLSSARSLCAPGSPPTWGATITEMLALGCSLEQPPTAH